MEKYLVALLELNQRVIIPELGAFILRQNEPKELVFNDLLAFDDGMLVDHIMQLEKLSKSEAQNRIKQFVDSIKKSLEAGDEYQLGKLGKLTMDDSSKIEFFGSGTKVSKETTEKETPPETDVEPEDKDAVAEEPAVEETPEASDSEDEVSPETDESDQISDVEEEAEADEPDEAPDVEEEVETKADEPDEAPEAEVEAEADEAVEASDVKAEAKPETDEPDEDSAVEEEVEPETVEGSGSDEGFVLAEGDSDVDVDATKEDAPLKPDSEEPPFHIESEEELEAEPEEEKVETSEEEIEEKEEVSEDKQEYKVVTSEPEPSPFSAYTQAPRAKKKVWPWIAGAAAFIILLIIAGWFIFPEQANNILGRKVAESAMEEPAFTIGGEAASDESETTGEEPLPSEDSESGSDEPEISSEEPEVQQEVQTPEIEEATPEVKSTEKRYYVVAGCFENKSNAENYLQKLLDQGFDASIFGVYKNMHAVCFSSFPSREAAVEELYRIKDTSDPKAWVLYY